MGILILGTMTIIALLGFADVPADMAVVTPRAIANVIIFIVFLVSYIKLKGQPAFEKICVICVFVAYAILAISQRNTYMYAAIFPSMLLVMLYMDKKLMGIGSALGIVINVIVGVKNFIIYPDTQSQSLMQAVFAVVFCITA